jgi:hypothetical protein
LLLILVSRSGAVSLPSVVADGSISASEETTSLLESGLALASAGNVEGSSFSDEIEQVNPC